MVLSVMSDKHVAQVAVVARSLRKSIISSSHAKREFPLHSQPHLTISKLKLSSFALETDCHTARGTRNYLCCVQLFDTGFLVLDIPRDFHYHALKALFGVLQR